MNTKFTGFFALLILTFTAEAQWQPDGATTGDIYYNNGNVGIGTGATALDAKVEIAAQGEGANVLKLSTERPWSFQQQGTGTGTHLVLRDLTGNKYFKIQDFYGVDAFSVQTHSGIAYFKGPVGIGTTTSSSAKLSVKGTIHAEEVRVDLNVAGPDYVFEPDYKLPSLAQLQAYIDQNKHLPEVPSAKTMERDGINLSDMNMILLKKVEELTLYLIEQDSRLSEMQKINSKQSDTIEKLLDEVATLKSQNKSFVR